MSNTTHSLPNMQQLFLEALRASLLGESVNWDEPLSPSEWSQLFRLAEKHSVLPMIFEAVHRSPAAMRADQSIFQGTKTHVIQAVMFQTMKTAEFLRLYRHLSDRGIEPIVVKGLIARLLYPNPDARRSSDEDLLIAPKDYEACHEALIEYGMTLMNPNQDRIEEHEVSYIFPDHPLYIELHKSLFPPASKAYGDLNQYFENAEERSIIQMVESVPVRTLGKTDHLRYLLLHALKHFLHSGFGIRQVCDIVLFANEFGSEVDWHLLYQDLKRIRAERFAKAVFLIGEHNLVFDPEMACMSEEWRKIDVDETMLLDDLLDAGVFGTGSRSRLHSSNMTLSAVAAQKNGQRAKRGITQSLFPPAKSLEGAYPFLKTYPHLLPIAWGKRFLTYRKEVRSTQQSVTESIRIGDQRIELLKEYGIIDE